MLRTRLYLVGWGIALLTALLDQGVKYAFLHTFSLYEAKNLTPFLNFTLVYNYGVAFSLFSEPNSHWHTIFLISLSGGVVLWMAIWLFFLKPTEKSLALGLSLIMGGALGNLIDRIVHGYVIDFLDVHLGNLHWPVFNVADSAVCLGAALLFFATWQKKTT